MIKISKKADYAVLLMAQLAMQEGADPADPPVSAQEIADRAGMSRPLAANLLKTLTRAGLLDSVRGAGGGYRLARATDTITLAQILEAVEGPLRLVECAIVSPERDDLCSLSGSCPSRGAMRVVHDRIARLMEDIRLDELLHHEHRGLLASGSPAPTRLP